MTNKVEGGTRPAPVAVERNIRGVVWQKIPWQIQWICLKN